MDEEHFDRSHLAKGEYVDYFEVTEDFVAFYIDCGQLGHESKNEKTKLYIRIITSPVGALRLATLLADKLDEHVQSYGEIQDEQGSIARVNESRGKNEF